MKIKLLYLFSAGIILILSFTRPVNDPVEQNPIVGKWICDSTKCLQDSIQIKDQYLTPVDFEFKSDMSFHESDPMWSRYGKYKTDFKNNKITFSNGHEIDEYGFSGKKKLLPFTIIKLETNKMVLTRERKNCPLCKKEIFYLTKT